MKLSKRLAALTIATATLVSGTAFATVTTWFHPDYVNYTAGTLSIAVGPDGFIAKTSGTPSGCSNQTLDTLKIWHETAKTALVTGKQLQLGYTNCTGGAYIDSVAIGP
ncbi:MAG TPA: hypothetical protein VER11_16245 [Polyangiaceae bacterium]|nr:hypothetical protein [Polyangiaceae bacterium]